MDAHRPEKRESDPAATQLAQAKAQDAAHHYHPFSDERFLTRHGPLMINKAKGTRIFAEQGIQLLDMVAGLGCVNIGYGHDGMAEAIAKAVRDLSFYHTFQQTTNPYAAALAETLANLAPAHLNKVFFANSGSEANETIIKLVRAYWRAKGQPDRTQIITRDHAYHGSTLYTASMNGLPQMHAAFGLPLAGIHHAQSPWWYRYGGDMGPADFGVAAARNLEDKILAIGADKVGAVVLEPIQVTAGAVIAPESYWPEIKRIVTEHDILLVIDEVVTGFGRCGRWLLHDELGIEADFLTMAKGLTSAYQPLAAAMISDRILDVVSATGFFQHGYTTSGHPVACAAALKNIEILDKEGLVKQAGSAMGKVFETELGALADHPLVGEVRTKGMLAGIELTADKASRRQYPLEQGVCAQVMNAALMRGVMVRAVGNALVLCPPLVISRHEMAFCASKLAEALDEVVLKLKAA